MCLISHPSGIDPNSCSVRKLVSRGICGSCQVVCPVILFIKYTCPCGVVFRSKFSGAWCAPCINVRFMKLSCRADCRLSRLSRRSLSLLVIGSSPEELDSVVSRVDDAEEPGDELTDDGGELESDEDKFVPEICTLPPLPGLWWW